jgi:rhodanese-related sulfurtransferase
MSLLNTYPHVKTITRDQLHDKLSNNEPVQVVNVLNPAYYNLGFIKGSKRIPVSELDKRRHELDRNREVVTYCAGYECSASSEGAEKLSAMGFNVSAYEGGIKEWKAAGLPTEWL